MKQIIFLLLFLPNVLFAGNCGNYSEKEMLALTMYHEARGEGGVGMQMVGEVVLNRVQSDLFPDTICNVVTQRSQFSWVHNNSWEPREQDLWQLSLHIADALLSEDLQYYNPDALYFVGPSALNDRWLRRLNLIRRYKNHSFFAQG